jgi:uncharacterized protein YndB with AHSA1/START domain
MSDITITAIVEAPIDKVWAYWTQPEHIVQWNHASDDWYCPRATNDLVKGGEFHYIMAAKDGSVSFDFNGMYEEVRPGVSIEYFIEDGRHVSVIFQSEGTGVRVTSTFEPEEVNSMEAQKGGWQAILDNFKKHAENQ